MPLNKACINKHYPPVEAAVTLEAIQQYARAYDHENPFFFDERQPGGIIAPPMFGMVPIWQSIVKVVTDPEVGADLLRLVHGEHEMEFIAPIRPEHVITSVATIRSITTGATGETMAIGITAHNQRGETVQNTIFTAFIRSTGSSRSDAGVGEQEPEHGEPLAAISQAIAADQTFRYAEASGDVNPIHLDANIAKMAGLPSIIVHGLCTMAFCSKAVIETVGASDPRRLRRLRVRFVRPVLPGQTITTRIWAAGETPERKTFEFETVNQNGRAVIRGGIAEISA
ncbi:MAG TPA: MaoC/PaaZ C-terminal domain-containing protein [Candidatus Binataceae bacterium]|jgi:acyl dehydratase|nr:MaoC/PaaZ C-terminal domain-containing protein [Candidatus Binataceae bacterium]